MNHDIRMHIEGALPERLLNRAIQNGADLAWVRRTGRRCIHLATDPAGAEILNELCTKYGLHCRVLHRGGRSAWLKRLRSRLTLLPGMLLCILICAVFLSRIWLIDIRFTGPSADLGNPRGLLARIHESGVKPGIIAGSVHTDLLQKELLAACPELSFIGVRIQGIRLLVEASPEVPAPRLYEIDRPRDLVAARDGVVESVYVYSGEAAVQPGDTVHAGQLLIRGEEAKSEEETTPVSALGSITARCWYEGSAQAPLTGQKLQSTGRMRTSCRLKLMDFSLPLLECTSFDREETQIQILPVVGLFLPLEIERSIHSEQIPVEHKTDPDLLAPQMEALARAEALAKLSADGIEYEIASAWTDVTQTENTLRVRAVYEIYTDIAVTRDALIEEVY